MRLIEVPDGRAQAPKVSLEAGAEYKASLGDRLDGHSGTRLHYRSTTYISGRTNSVPIL